MKKKSLILFIFSFSALGAAASGKMEKDTTKYSVVISFFSRASGIDSQARKEVDAFISEFESKCSVAVEKNETRWGREGELDYCISLSRLSRKDQKRFIKGVKRIAKKSGQVNILENSPCLHKR